jgi:hypothetical protein
VKLRPAILTLGLPAAVSHCSLISLDPVNCTMAGRAPSAQRGGGGPPRPAPPPRGLDGCGDLAPRGGGQSSQGFQ